MAFSNTYETGVSPTQGSGVSNREDLSSLLSVLSPEQTPILSVARKSKATATFHEWSIDKLADVQTAGVSEGSDVSSFDDKFSGMARVGNYVQHFRRAWKVSRQQQAVTNAVGVDKAGAKVKAMKEVKRDIEATIVSANTRSAEDGAGTAYAMAGLKDILQAAATSLVLPSDYQCAAGQIEDINGSFLTEAELQGVLETIYQTTGDSSNFTCFADTAIRQDISDFTRVDSSQRTAYQVNEDATSKKVTLSVTVVDTDFGFINVVNTNPDCSADNGTGFHDAFILNTSKYGVADLVGMGSTDLEDQGGGSRGYVDCMATLVVDQPQSHGRIYDGS